MNLEAKGSPDFYETDVAYIPTLRVLFHITMKHFDARDDNILNHNFRQSCNFRISMVCWIALGQKFFRYFFYFLFWIALLIWIVMQWIALLYLYYLTLFLNCLTLFESSCNIIDNATAKQWCFYFMCDPFLKHHGVSRPSTVLLTPRFVDVLLYSCRLLYRQEQFFAKSKVSFLQKSKVSCSTSIVSLRQLFGCHAIYLLSKEWRDVFAVVVHYANSSKNSRNYSVRYFFYRSKNYY